MPLPSSGAISLSQVNTELNLSSTAQISMGDSNVRGLFGVPSGAISMSDGYGKSNDQTGVTWTYQTSLSSTYGSINPQFIQYIDSQFMISGGSNSRVLVSSDGVTWSIGTTVSGANWFGAVVGLGKVGSTWIAVSPLRAATSGNFSSWSSPNSFQPVFGYNADMGLSNGSVFVAANYYNGQIGRSTDGTTWSGTSFTNTSFNRLLLANGRFFVVGYQMCLRSSTDGLNWANHVGIQSVSEWANANIWSLAWNGSIYCIVGSAGVATSSDLNTFTHQTNLANEYPVDIIWTGSRFVLVTYYGKSYTSQDGINWTFQPGLNSSSWGSTFPLDMAWSGSKICLVSSSAQSATSPS